MAYAQNTTVPVARSRTDVEQLLAKHGATAFGYLSQGDAQIIVFEVDNRRVLIRLPMPDREDRHIARTASGQRRSPAEANKAYEQAVRARWRALVLIVKAKLEAVAAGISTVEREFFYDIALPDGHTVGEWAAPQLDEVYRSGEMPALLPGRPDR